VTLLGSPIQMLILSVAIGAVAFFSGGAMREGAFIGATFAMSSSSIVVRNLQPYGSEKLFKRIAIGTLLMQDCLVGVLFAVVPLFEGGKAESAQDVAWFFTKLLGLLLGFLSMCAVLSLAIMPPIMRWVVGSCGPEIARLFAVSFCFALASLGDVMGVSSELGAFCAGAVIGNTRSKRMAADFDFGKYFEGHVDQVEAVFVALFLASIGIILSPAFLFQHALFLGMTFVVCIAFKVLIFLAVVKAFRYPTMVSVAVAFSLAPISEFAFVILSSCYKAGVIKRHWYMALLGVTSCSMFLAPFANQAAKPFARLNSARAPASPTIELVR